MAVVVAKKQHSNYVAFLYGKPFPHFLPENLTFCGAHYLISSVQYTSGAFYSIVISLWDVVRFSKFPNQKPNQVPKFPNFS